MESNKFGYWLQVGANVGILAGLVMVGLQINQNTELTRLGLYSSEETDYVSMGAMQSGDTLAGAWAKAIDDPESLKYHRNGAARWVFPKHPASTPKTGLPI